VGAGVGLPGVAGSLLAVGLGAKVGVTSLSNSTSYDGTGAFAELTFGDVNLGGGVVGGWAVDSVEVSVVRPVLDVDVAPDVTVVRLLIAITGLEVDFDALSTLLAVLLRLLEAVLLVDSDLLAVLWAAGAVLFVDADLLLVACVAFGWAADGGREGFVMLFVTFPSDVRSLRRKLCFAFYLDFGCFFGDSVTPVRGREDTEGDRYAGVKVQVCGSLGVPS
jgi:hypothetical protein